MPKLKAIHTFTGPDGNRTKGAIFETTDKRAQFLVAGGYAALIAASQFAVENDAVQATVPTPHPRKK